jgi:hypothetical protein
MVKCFIHSLTLYFRRWSCKEASFADTGSGAFLTPGFVIRDPGWKKFQIPDHPRSCFWELIISFFGLIIRYRTYSLLCGSGILSALGPRWEKSDPGSGLNISGSVTLSAAICHFYFPYTSAKCSSGSGMTSIRIRIWNKPFQIRTASLNRAG